MVTIFSLCVCMYFFLNFDATLQAPKGFLISARPSPTAASNTAVLASPGGDGCQHVYLDLGTNTGMQFRKLFNRDAYPAALIRPVFDRYFGLGRRLNVCAWGWEPNPRHAPNLLRLQDGYRALGRRLTIFPAAAGTFEGHATFHSDGVLEHQEWGSTVVPLPAHSPTARGCCVRDGRGNLD